MNTKFIITIITAIFLIAGTVKITTDIIKKRNNTIARLEHNNLVGNIDTKIWKNKYGQIVAEHEALVLTIKEFKNSNDKDIIKLKDQINKQGLKIKNLEYELSIETGFQIDTITEIRIDTVDRYIINSIDSLYIGDFKLRRTQKIGNLASHYTISYNPELYVSISRFKEGKWRFINIFKPRVIRYKTVVTSSDTLLKPKKIILVKISK